MCACSAYIRVYYSRTFFFFQCVTRAFITLFRLRSPPNTESGYTTTNTNSHFAYYKTELIFITLQNLHADDYCFLAYIFLLYVYYDVLRIYARTATSWSHIILCVQRAPGVCNTQLFVIVHTATEAAIILLNIECTYEYICGADGKIFNVNFLRVNTIIFYVAGINVIPA